MEPIGCLALIATLFLDYSVFDDLEDDGKGRKALTPKPFIQPENGQTWQQANKLDCDKDA